MDHMGLNNIHFLSQKHSILLSHKTRNELLDQLMQLQHYFAFNLHLFTRHTSSSTFTCQIFFRSYMDKTYVFLYIVLVFVHLSCGTICTSWRVVVSEKYFVEDWLKTKYLTITCGSKSFMLVRRSTPFCSTEARIWVFVSDADYTLLYFWQYVSLCECVIFVQFNQFQWKYFSFFSCLLF